MMDKAVYLAAKRTSDIVISGMGLLVFSPVIALIAPWVRFRIGTPVLFRQLRPGLRGEPFTLCKFRTMTTARVYRDALCSFDTL